MKERLSLIRGQLNPENQVERILIERGQLVHIQGKSSVGVHSIKNVLDCSDTGLRE